MKKYPEWICSRCGNKYGYPKDAVTTYHSSKCDVCGEEGGVTEPRDFNWPTFPNHEAPNIFSTPEETDEYLNILNK